MERAIEYLNELREDHHVELVSSGDEWQLTVTSKRRGNPFTYTGTNLTRIINAAWAGEPSRRV